jgi:FkbM family methyltransferase
LLLSAVRGVRLAVALGAANGYKLAVLARITRRSIALHLPECRHPFAIRGRTTDDTVVEQVFANREYPILADFQPRTIIDAGANCGAAAVYFASHYPDAQIVAVEPERSNFDLLTQNVRDLENVKPVLGALWSRRCSLALAGDADVAKYAFQVEETRRADGDGSSIPAYTVQDILQGNGWEHVDVLKLDIEGAEHEVFAANSAAWIDRVSVIMVELHEELSPGCGRALFSALGDRDYSVSVCGEHLVIVLKPSVAERLSSRLPA